jgi:hypothetical protein
MGDLALDHAVGQRPRAQQDVKRGVLPCCAAISASVQPRSSSRFTMHYHDTPNPGGLSLLYIPRAT